MKKNILLLLATLGTLSCKQSIDPKPQSFVTETINSIRNYKYIDLIGKHLTIENGNPKGDLYIDANGKEYFKVIFWTRIINATDHSLQLDFNFPIHSYENASLPGKYNTIIIAPDTMTVAKEPLYNYGLTNFKSLLDGSGSKPSSLTRTINSKQSSGFYVVLLRPRLEVQSGILRTGLHIKGQKLFYRISRYKSAPGLPLMDEKDIYCGRINLKDLTFQN